MKNMSSTTRYVILGGALVLALVIAVVVIFVAQDDDDAESSADGGTTTPTGDANVDRVIAGFKSGDTATIESLLQFTKIKCVAQLPSPSTGAPPLCPSGTADGTEVDAFLAGNCEPSWVLKGQHTEVLNMIVGRSQSSPDLYAVTYAKPEEFPVGGGGLPPTQHTAIYGRAGDANTTWYAGVDQGIPYVFNACGQTPEAIADRRDTTKPDDGYLLPPGSP